MHVARRFFALSTQAPSLWNLRRILLLPGKLGAVRGCRALVQYCFWASDLPGRSHETIPRSKLGCRVQFLPACGGSFGCTDDAVSPTCPACWARTTTPARSLCGAALRHSWKTGATGNRWAFPIQRNRIFCPPGDSSWPARRETGTQTRARQTAGTGTRNHIRKCGPDAHVRDAVCAARWTFCP